MNVQKRKDVLIYCLSSGPTIPEWMGDRAKRNLSKRDEGIRRRIELLQDFQMPCSSSKLCPSRDGRYLLAAGTYPPRMRCYDTAELGIKFERYMDAHVLDMCMLGDDYGKVALLMDDRTVAFHAHYGAHEKIRIPTFGRGMAYEPTTCDLFLTAKGRMLYRFNLEEGRFQEPWDLETTSKSSSQTVSGTCISISPSYPLTTVGCDDGLVRCFDNRMMDSSSSSSTVKPVLSLDVASACQGYGYHDTTTTALYGGSSTAEITSIAHERRGGMHMAVGTSHGVVALYDVRSSKPMMVMEHKHGTDIHTVQFHSSSQCILSGDERLVKIWKYKRANAASSDAMSESDDDSDLVVANVEASGGGKFTHFIVGGDETDPTGDASGLLLCAKDEPKMDSFFIPSLGLAPKWCSFLDSITEELQERDLNAEGRGADSNNQTMIYDNYKFISREQVDTLGISHLVGTPLLRGYMHGFFLDSNLYNRIQAVANPFEYEEYRKKKLKERLEAKRSSRIVAVSNTKSTSAKDVAVNQDLAERLQDKEEKRRAKKKTTSSSILEDDRFGGLFTNPDFEIDQDAEDFKLRNPSGVAASKQRQKKRRDDMDSDDEDDDDEINDDDISEQRQQRPVGFRRFEQLQQEEFDNDEDYHESSSDDDDDGIAGGKVRGEEYESVKRMMRGKAKKDNQKDAKRKKQSEKKRREKRKTAVLYEAATDSADGAKLGFGEVDDQMERRYRELNEMSLQERLASLDEQQQQVDIRSTNTSRELTFIPKDVKRKQERQREQQLSDRSSKRKRRGTKELGFKTPFKHHERS